MSVSLDPLAQDALQLFRAVRLFLEEHRSSYLPTIEQALKVLEDAMGLPAQIKVGFLGAAQVGKSSLINALLDRRLLPAGGIGPLTAQATQISHASSGLLRIKYHSKNRMNKLRFGIERHVERRATLQKDEEQDIDLVSIATEVDAAAEAEKDGAGKSSPGRYMLEQARLMLCGSQEPSDDVTPALLLDGIRAIMDLPPRGPKEALEGFAARIAELRTKLGGSAEFAEENLGKASFNREIRLHATEYLSPLVERLELLVNHDLLRDLTLVDLPGVGVVHDPGGRIAEDYMPSTDGLVLVVRNDGLTESVNDVLERTGVITRLLFQGAKEPTTLHVAIVVTHLDNVARERHAQRAQEAEEQDLPAPRRDQVFEELAEQMSQKIRGTIQHALLASPAFDVLSEDERLRRTQVIVRLCQEMSVTCVSSPDYMMLLREERGSFLDSKDATGIPRFRAAVQRMAAAAKGRRDTAIRSALESLQAMMDDSLLSVQQMYQEGNGKAVADWARLREDLQRFATPLREQMAAHHGEARAMLQSAVPKALEGLVGSAQNRAQKKLMTLYNQGLKRHYQSLNAALTRNGVYQFREIDYPTALTMTFVDTIASAWETTVVDAVREAVKTLATRDAKLVERLCTHAQEMDDRIVAEAQIEAQRRLLAERAKTCVAWTKERLESLSQEVQGRLLRVVAKLFTRACQEAQKKGLNRGMGAKLEILKAFHEGGERAVEQAAETALSTLNEQYARMRRELDEGFFTDLADPLKAALDALTSEELQRARRSDAQRRRQVHETVAHLRTQLAAQRAARGVQ